MGNVEIRHLSPQVINSRGHTVTSQRGLDEQVEKILKIVRSEMQVRFKNFVMSVVPFWNENNNFVVLYID